MRIQKAFDLPENTLEDALADDLEFRTVQVTTGKKKSKGEHIPQPPRKKDDKPEFSLDTDRIDKLTQETKEVVAALSTLFDESTEAAEEELAEEANKESIQLPDWMNELDSTLAKPLQALLALKDPSLKDLEKITTSHHL